MHMHFDGFNDEYWNEHQWEAHLNEVEKKSEQLRKFISSDPKGNVPRWITLLNESLDEDDAVDAFIEEELLLDEAYFPEEEDWDEEDDEWDDEDFLFGFDQFEEYDEDEEEFGEGEEWKMLSEDFTYSDHGSIENLSVYLLAREFAVDILKWAEKIDGKYRTKALNEFVSEALKIGAKLAGGYSFGFEPDYLGGNIAYTKKALYFANRSLELLHNQKGAAYLNKNQYAEFHTRLFEIRNDIGVYIQELRDQFNLGLE